MDEMVFAPHDGRWLVQVPDGTGARLLLAADDDWPRDGRLRVEPTVPPDGWDRVDGTDRVGVVDVTRRGPSLDIVLDRGVKFRCRFLLAPDDLDKRGSATDDATDVLWWQTGATARSIPPRQRVPTARERGVARLTVTVDRRERRPWKFADAASPTVTTVEGTLPSGDYGVVDPTSGEPVGLVERKKSSDFRGCLTTGRLSEQMSVLAVAAPRTAVVVEATYANSMRSKRVARHRLADLIAAVQASFPNVPLVFAGSRKSAEEWTWRFLAAALSHHTDEALPLIGRGAVPTTG